MHKVIKPPMTLTENKTCDFTAFLAGSIEMGKAVNWQDSVIKYFSGSDKIQFFNPRNDSWDDSIKQSMTDANFYQQVGWEMNALDKADLIIMYFDPDSKSPISLLELGLYANSGKMIVVCPHGFYRRGNVQAVCEKYNIPLFSDLHKFLNELGLTL